MNRTHKITELAPKTWHIGELNRTSTYLLEGSERSLLIDTGMGAGDLSSVVRALTDLPVQVVLTHAHPDHAGGMALFQDVWVHAADIPAAFALRKNMTEGFIRFDRPDYDGEIQNLDPRPRFHDVRNQDCFDLGGRVVKIYETPGHTAGSISLVDYLTGYLFSGDACNHNELLGVPSFWRRLIPGCTLIGSIPQNRASLELIRSLGNAKNFTGHFDEIGGQPAHPSTAADLIRCCDKVLEGSFSIENTPETGMDQYAQRIQIGCAQLTYNPERINEEWIIGDIAR